ncbi:hypothetical protein HPB51_013127 [Rhipicephalus microplus]|uniref:DDE Tnp4 domain-containing protein n=1 Tax=Rhipicephalus microplus TaxID=6941 RepID=A0A9J6D549_RHIMP|nr:hypothetical protein HPB51_013127 [Rhipicephalus microplus]
MERQRKIAALKLLIILKRRRAFLKKYWVRPTWANRAGESGFFTALEKMKNGDESLFYTFYRMSPATFDVLHSLVKEKLTKDQCPSRYLSSGMLGRDAAMAFRVGIETARNIIHETCTVLWEVLAPEYMKTPREEKWREIAAGFRNRWQFPNCVGAVDGKHIQIKCPRNGGSLYFNYKGTHFIVLMAVVDSQYLFRLVNVRAPGRFSDGGIFQDSSIGERLHEGELSLPRAAMLPRSGRALCGKRLRHSCLSLIHERQINLEPENAEAVVKATCVLHNFLSSNAASTYCPPGYADFQDTFGNVSGGAWRQGPGSTTVFGLEKPKGRNCSKVASAVRQEFVKHFSEEGRVPWQWKLPGVAPHHP